MLLDNDEGSGFVFVLMSWYDYCQKLTFEMITSDRRRNS